MSDRQKVIQDQIIALRNQILVHACIFEIYQDQVVGRGTWQLWSDQLLSLQEKYPDLTTCDYYDAIFKVWDGVSTVPLPLNDDTIRAKASFLLDNKQFTPNFL